MSSWWFRPVCCKAWVILLLYVTRHLHQLIKYNKHLWFIYLDPGCSVLLLLLMLSINYVINETWSLQEHTQANCPLTLRLHLCILSGLTKIFHILFDTIPPWQTREGNDRGRGVEETYVIPWWGNWCKVFVVLPFTSQCWEHHWATTNRLLTLIPFMLAVQHQCYSCKNSSLVLVEYINTLTRHCSHYFYIFT